MDQAVPVPGAQNEPFFELLHPNTANRPALPPLPSAAQNGSPKNGSDSSSSSAAALDSIPPSYDFQLSHYPKSDDGHSGFAPPLPDGRNDYGSHDGRIDYATHAQHRGFPPPLHEAHQGHYTSDPSRGLDYSKVEERRGFDYNKVEEERQTCNPAIVAAVENTMKNYIERVLVVLDGVNGRLSNLESTVQGLEHSIEKLKLSEEDKQNENNGRLILLEHLMKEIHARVQLVHDKQMVDEAKTQLSHLQPASDKAAVVQTPPSDAWQPPREEIPSHMPPPEPPVQVQQHMLARYPPQGPPQYPHPPPPQAQNFGAAQNAPPQTVNEPNKTSTQQPYPPTSQVLPGSGQPVPPQMSMQMSSYPYQPPPPPQGLYNPNAETTPYGHMQSPQHHPAPPPPATPAPPPPPTGNYLPEAPHYASGPYAGPQRQHPVQQEVLHSTQQHGPGVSQQAYEPHGRMGAPSAMPSPYAQPHQPSPPVPPMYEPYRTGQPVPSAPTGASSGGYPRLPTAHPVHSAQPAVPVGGSNPHPRNQVDEVVEKVATMGFSRDQVRSAVRNLTENGQPVELNVVLDKLMNGGDSHQPPRGWFGRG